MGVSVLRKSILMPFMVLVPPSLFTTVLPKA